MATLKKHVPTTSAVELSSYVLTGILCALAIWKGLLPGLLSACLGAALVAVIQRVTVKGRALPGWLAATAVILTPLVLLAVLAMYAKGLSVGAFAQYQALIEHIATTVIDIRQKLPPELAKMLPKELTAVEQWVAQHLKGYAASVASAGKAGLHSTLLVFVGLVIGSLIGISERKPKAGPLTLALRERAKLFNDAFRQIVAAQVWIAGFNALLTALFLWGVLPLFDVTIPYSGALVSLTFVAGLVPIVGNLLCNVVLTIAGVSVSPMVGLSCLLFLIGIHKFEYFINAKVVGSKTATSAWELLAVMFAAEAVVGVTGLVAGPLFYAYLKKELTAKNLI